MGPPFLRMFFRPASSADAAIMALAGLFCSKVFAALAYPPCGSDRGRGDVVAEEPFVALRHALPSPFAIYVCARLGRIGQRRVMKAVDVGSGALHREPRALPPCLLIAKKSVRYV